ncbi:MAG TPA: putative peptidoglycan glycosyltransferase FtsW [Alphaproteobacteria bacterium]|nr:putative peptidoglycan glycosyltransferase FtsW [Alphaproteobacteria bacterium]
MNMAFARTDHSIVGRWWWTVDRWTLVALAVLIGVGMLLVTAASPPVAERIHAPTFYFVIHQAIMLVPTIAVMLGVSLLSPRGVRRLALGTFLLFYLLTALTLVAGHEIKGATRWIGAGPFSLQPSEFLKPAFAVVTAWLFAKQHSARAAGQIFPGYVLAIVLYAAVVGVLMLQPDFGMTFVCTAIWFGEFFLAGLPIVFVLALAVMAVGGLVGAYFVFPHIASRIDRFLDPASGDTYQVDRSLQAFVHGGLTGTGPGQGTVKMSLPDAHADFIFAVAGEELGLAATLFIVSLFGFIVLRGFARALKDSDLFIVLAVGGLFTQFGLQALVHMGSSLHLLPAKGMTLPFISYGGSSLLALGLGTGMALALTRTRFPGGEQ